MRGSIAVWHDVVADGAKGYAPKVEIHINIWKSNIRGNQRRYDLFDIGFRFREVRSLRTLSLSLPFTIKVDQVSDLFDVMHHTLTLSTLFNETLYAGDLQDDGNTFAALGNGKQVQFYVARCSVNDFSISDVDADKDSCSVIMFHDSFFDRMRERVGDQYFRLRILIPFNIKNGFISEENPKESAFLSTISTNEIVEFRLNERRNFSPSIVDRLTGSADLIAISSVHYFLVRDMGVEMTQSHTPFRKMRRLEPGIWDRYLRGETQISAENMIIYQWKSLPPDQEFVESFTALATFRAYYTGYLFIYAAVVVALGAMGSAFQALSAGPTAAFVTRELGWMEPWSSAAANAILLTILTLIMVSIVKLARKKTS